MLLAAGKVGDQRWPLTESHPLGQNDGFRDKYIIQGLLWISYTTSRPERCSVCLSNSLVVEIKGDGSDIHVIYSVSFNDSQSAW